MSPLQAFPLQFNHLNPNLMIADMLRSVVCADMLSVKGECVRFGIRSKVVPYAEEVRAVWVILAVKYQADAP